MRKLLTASIASAVLVLGGAASPAMAHDSVPPCNDADGDGSSSGQEYGQNHIQPHAQHGGLGSSQDEAAEQGSGHSPGSHQGYSTCDPSGD